MQIALYGSIAWRDPLGLGRAIELASRHGWDAIDARGMSLDLPRPDGRQRLAFGYDMLGPRWIRGSARADFRERLADAGLRLLGIYCSVPINLPGEEGAACRRHVVEYIKLGADLGVDWIRPINNFAEGLSSAAAEEAYRRTIDGMQEIAKSAADLGVGLLLENNENTVTPDAASLLGVKHALGGSCRVGIAYDAVNAYFQGHDPMAQLDALGGRYDVLHVKNVRRHQGEKGDYMPRGDASYEWTSLAEGDVDWKKLIAKAAAAGFDGPLVYEYVNPFKGMPASYWDALPEPDEAARIEGQYLRKLLAEVTT